ncbi:DUF2334 domain-containing protein [Desulfosporosinus acidiphilus]|uniref:DUF2334 domain-containing protein n=1 Tax=Desulfosporosinus acidiphilus TaxID=885581 RepID=UPI001A9A2FD4|nr:DUF2334 domain-containing protein [Desulfosporosinus acidiphilus]
MPWKKLSMILASFLVLFLMVSVPPAQGSSPENTPGLRSPAKVLVFYERSTRFGETFPLVKALEEYLGHFDVQVEEMACSQWTPGSLKGYDVIFYLGDYKRSLPNNLLSEMSQVHKLFWFEQNIEQYAGFEKWIDFHDLGLLSDYVSLHYNGTNLSLNPSEKFNCAYPDDAQDRVVADNLHGLVPFVWEKDNVVYFSRLDFQNPFNLILGGILEDILSGNQAASKQVLLRIEDVQPLTPPDTLVKLINTLAIARIPFALTVTPLMELDGKTVSLIDYPQLVKVLQTVESNGGCIILKGYEVTNGTELEYWNAKGDKPFDVSKENAALSGISKGIQLLAGLNLYPVAFEVPGSAMSLRGYKVLAQHFTTLSGSVQLSDLSSAQSIDVPFTYRSKLAGMLVYPENLGYYDPKLLDPSGTILNKARQLSVVSDCTAGFFFHSYLQADKLLPIIKGLHQMNYQFVDLRSTKYQVTAPNISIAAQNGYRNIKSDIPAVSIDQTLKGLRLSVRNFFYALVALLLIILLIFLYILTRIRRSKSNLYEKRRS